MAGESLDRTISGRPSHRIKAAPRCRAFLAFDSSGQRQALGRFRLDFADSRLKCGITCPRCVRRCPCRTCFGKIPFLELLGEIFDAGFEDRDALAQSGLRQVRKLYFGIGYALRFWSPTARQYSSYCRATSASMLPGGRRSKKSRSRPMSGTSGSTFNCMISLSTPSTMS
jgi:hypothetical protein